MPASMPLPPVERHPVYNTRKRFSPAIWSSHPERPSCRSLRPNARTPAPRYASPAGKVADSARRLLTELSKKTGRAGLRE